MMSTLKAILKTVAALVILVALVSVSLHLMSNLGLLQKFLGFTRIERSAMSVLRSEQIAFLVTDRITTLAYVSIHEGNWFTGYRDGVLVGPVSFYYGIDIEKFAEDSIELSGYRMVIHTPDPEILDVAPRTSEFKFLTKSSAIMEIADLLEGSSMEQELVSMLDSCARAQALEYGLLPSKDDLLIRLNGMAPFLAEYLSVESVEFQ